MAISTAITRLAGFYKRYGLAETIRRAALAIERALFSNRMVLFFCDLSEPAPLPVVSWIAVSVEPKRACAELNQQDLRAMTSFWNPKLASRRINERFNKGAIIWLIKSADGLVGYGWTLQGCTVEPHYFPLGERDVHLFDFHVFPQYRGQGMNPLLVSHILARLAAEGATRAFIEATEWNHAQLSSLGKTPFHPFGRAKKWTFLRRTIVSWARIETFPQERNAGGERAPAHVPSKDVRSCG